jgi:phage terminase large subunit GpA-like protein
MAATQTTTFSVPCPHCGRRATVNVMASVDDEDAPPRSRITFHCPSYCKPSRRTVARLAATSLTELPEHQHPERPEHQHPEPPGYAAC